MQQKFITKCFRFFIKKCHSLITKCDSYTKCKEFITRYDRNKKLKLLNFICIIWNNIIKLLCVSIFMKIGAHLSFVSNLSLAGGRKSKFSNSNSAMETTVI